ncbi:MAG: tRNA pseudouridine(55) synthase TruB [Lachnospiraceae bacterium]|nr:tRNA pseudouridine(55) synthase TruB [Ruminococcus sp.]MCM1275329.1 tRNA pseudouridine(55) synthase TruB [Lachnospiraceae bacterium]
MTSGIIVVNKPREFTSFDVVAVMRGCYRTKKVGHSGTLDPMATGVLPVFIGAATKAVSILPDSGKSYRAGFRLGLTSDTLDVWGKLSEQVSVNVSESALRSVLERFRGEIEQVPPMYSALKVNGRKLCDLARQGIEIERQPRRVTISRLELVEFDGTDGVIDADCSSGTYIRALVDDIGKALGTGAVMTNLVRTRACGFALDGAYPLAELKTKPLDELESLLLPIESVFGGYPEIRLGEAQKRLYLNGVRLDLNRLRIPQKGEMFRVYADGEFLGIAKAAGDELISVKRF